MDNKENICGAEDASTDKSTVRKFLDADSAKQPPSAFEREKSSLVKIDCFVKIDTSTRKSLMDKSAEEGGVVRRSRMVKQYRMRPVNLGNVSN